MQYDLTIDDVSSIQRRLKFRVAKDLVTKELDEAFRDVGRRARLPGFRPGHIPRQLLETRFGRSVKAELGSKLIDRSWKEAMKGLPVAGAPALEEQGTLERGADFTFTIMVDVKPSVTVSDYTGITVKFPVTKIEEREVDVDIKRRLQGQARIEEVTEDRAVVAGDLVLTELVLKSGDEVVVNEPGTMINVDRERYYPGVQGLVLDLKKGDSKDGVVVIAESSALENLRGKEFQATVKVLGIQANRVPELTDDVAKTLGFEGGVDGMRTAVRAKLQEGQDEQSRNQARANLLEILVDRNAFDVPKGLVDEQLQALTEELRLRRAYQGIDSRTTPFTDTEMEDLRRRAVFAAKASCILAAIGDTEKIVVGDAEIEKKIDEIASMRGQTAAAIRGYLEREGALPMLSTRIREELTLEWLMERSTLEETTAGAASATPTADASSDEPAAKPKKKAKKKADAE